ncbi:MAG TPA: hypothetical protein PKA27_15220 [Fimbriimonadaceae bacterium]|nr:hypothetical protein [Fimbriimonadaceae bacterium]
METKGVYNGAKATYITPREIKFHTIDETDWNRICELIDGLNEVQVSTWQSGVGMTFLGASIAAFASLIGLETATPLFIPRLIITLVLGILFFVICILLHVSDKSSKKDRLIPLSMLQAELSRCRAKMAVGADEGNDEKKVDCIGRWKQTKQGVTRTFHFRDDGTFDVEASFPNNVKEVRSGIYLFDGQTMRLMEKDARREETGDTGQIIRSEPAPSLRTLPASVVDNKLVINNRAYERA